MIIDWIIFYYHKIYLQKVRARSFRYFLIALMADLYQDTKRYIGALTLMRRVTNTNLVFFLTEHFPQENGLFSHLLKSFLF